MATINMNLTVPVVGPAGTQGPTWATDLNTDLDLIDLHDHSTGKGVKITPAGININQDLSLNSFGLTSVDQIGLINKSGTQPTAASKIYEFGGELFFNDASGNQVQLTSGGAIDVSSLGTITGDYSTSTADLSYVDISKDFIFRQSATLTANISCGPIKIYRNVASSPYAQIQLNASQAGNLDWTLPVAFPGSTLPIKSSSAGVMSISQIVTADITDGNITTVKIADSNVTTAKIADGNVTTAKILDSNVTTAKIADLNVTTAKIADGNVTTAKIANSNVTPAKLTSAVFGAGNFTSTTNPLAGTTAYSTLSSHTVTASGVRPFQMFCVPDTVAGYLQIRLTRTAAGTLEVRLRVQRDGTNIGEARYSYVAGGLSTTCFGSFPVWYDPSPSAGSRTYTLQYEVFADAGGTNTVELFGRFYALEV